MKPYRVARRSGVLTLASLILGIAGRPLAAQPAHCRTDSPVTAENSLLRELAAEDQSVRRGATVARTDDMRVALVLEELSRGSVCAPVDHARAALVLDHSPLTIRDGVLIAVRPTDYLLAHLLASRALEAGYEPARILVAQTIDRYLTFTTGVQRYGTNRLNDLNTGEESLVPIDRATTDGERARFGVPPLATLLTQFPERERPAPRPSAATEP